jgi:3-hydroxyisobutyrate dehydrogenase-like beta-hydroxyacid dehydrogenase
MTSLESIISRRIDKFHRYLYKLPLMRVGFIGLGRMGAPMARNLAKAGYALSLFDIRANAAVSLAAELGARALPNAAAIARQSDVVILSLPAHAQVTEVMRAPEGILAGATRDLIVADTTTVGVAESREMAEQSAEAGVRYLDAPVSGAPIGITSAKAGTLTVMVGGDLAAFESSRPVLAAIGGNVRWVGGSGSGTAIKLINQAIYIAYMAAFAEGLALGEGLGLELDALLDILGTSAAGNPTITTKYEELKGLSSKAFAIDSALGYLDKAEEAGRESTRGTPIFDTARASLRRASQRSLGKADLIVARNDYLPKRSPA